MIINKLLLPISISLLLISNLVNAQISKISILCFDVSKTPRTFNFELYDKEKKIILVKNDSAVSFLLSDKKPPPSNGLTYSLNLFLNIQDTKQLKGLAFAIVDPQKATKEQADDVMVFESVNSINNIINSFYCYDSAKKLSNYISK